MSLSEHITSLAYRIVNTPSILNYAQNHHSPKTLQDLKERAQGHKEVLEASRHQGHEMTL